MLVYISEPVMLRKNFWAIYHITLALQRALLCVLIQPSVYIYSHNFWHFNLALKNIVGLRLYHTHPRG